jgi:hypothetical protein
MSDEAWTAIAALGAAALTALASLGVIATQEWLRRREAECRALQAAVATLLTRSVGVALQARYMGEMMKVRSGLGEGLDIALHHRKPLDLFELYGWMARERGPLDAAWSDVWCRGDQLTVQLANKLVGTCSDLLGVSTNRQPVGNGWDRARRWVGGDRWTPEMLEGHQAATEALAEARRDLAAHARLVLGYPSVELFAPMTSE